MMDEFVPARPFRNPHLQSVLASAGVRRWVTALRGPSPERGRTEHVLDCGDGVRLQAFRTEPPDGMRSRSPVILLHGWEGSHLSGYLVSAASRLLHAGHRIFRLNFRDHGDTHHLNEGLFHSCRLDEVVGAVGALSRLAPGRPPHLVGFSLGGNFALRVASRAPAAGLALASVVAISPVVDPPHVLDWMERGPRSYERYFVRKWGASLRRKQRLFPDRYDFRELDGEFGLRELTRRWVERYTEFPSLAAYLDGYSIAGGRLGALTVRASVIAAEDDPIIPVEDFARLEAGPQVSIEMTRFGGHCGFIRGPSLRSWVDQRIVDLLAVSEREDR